MVFYFTATGNSLYVAKQLDEERLSIPQEMNRENRHYKVHLLWLHPCVTCKSRELAS